MLWLQTPHWYADHPPADRPDFTGVTSLAECDDTQLAWLATQQGFRGVTQVDGEHCTWHRQMDIQPADGSRDTGRMIIEGERMIETGTEAGYVEIRGVPAAQLWRRGCARVGGRIRPTALPPHLAAGTASCSCAAAPCACRAQPI